jgi:hypothetical protein
MDQNKNKTAKALANPDMALIITATLVLSGAMSENIFAIMINKGAPGG